MPHDPNLAHTYSIVAFDPHARQLGVAVQSRYFSVGPVVPWLEPGVGAVATQSFVEISYGPLGLALMRGGKSAHDTLRSLLAGDPDSEMRQVAMLDANGITAVHTGKRCIPHAGHILGKNFSVQANLMAKDTVWNAMAQAFRDTRGDLAERMLRSLEAAQEEGGDIRGQMSAALMVVSSERNSPPGKTKPLDLRVDDHSQPVSELRRLLTIAKAYRNLRTAHELLMEENREVNQAIQEFERAVNNFPAQFDPAEEIFWFARQLVEIGELEQALPLFTNAFTLNPAWRTIVPRLVRAGRLPDDENIIARILSG